MGLAADGFSPRGLVLRPRAGMLGQSGAGARFGTPGTIDVLGRGAPVSCWTAGSPDRAWGPRLDADLD